MSWYDVWSTHFSRGKLKKKKHSGTYFFSGVNKRLLLQIKSRRTHQLHKISSKTLTSKRYITFALIATTHPRSFSWFSFFFAKRRWRVATRVHRFVALSQLSRAEKNQGKPLWSGWLHISRRKIYSLMLQLHHDCYNFSKIEQNHR